MTAIIDIEGIGPAAADKLKAAGVATVEKLLEVAGPAKGRETLAEQTGLNPKQLLEWVNRADLYRIKGVGEEYSDLLENAGVDTVVELSRRRADNLHAKIMEINTEKKLVRRPPTLAQVQAWVEEAKTLPRMVHY